MHARERALLATAAQATAREAWAAVAKGDISATWAEQIPRLLSYLTAAQFAAANSADTYVHAALAEQGMATGAAARVQPMAFAGIASDGRPLETLLALPAIEAKTAIARGAPVTRAMATGRALVELAAHTQVADAGRTADQAAIVARTGGYVRMVVGKTCSRCLILAGRWYRWNAGFARHPKCLPADVTVSGPGTIAASRRLYQGELVIVSTARGQRLPVTGNHPILTDRGWIPANLINEGDYVVNSTNTQGAKALVVPDHDQVPSRIEDLWRSGRMTEFCRVPSSAEDFHGDGTDGYVDVVFPDSLLTDRIEPPGLHGGMEHLLPIGLRFANRLAGNGSIDQLIMRSPASPYGVVGRSGLPGPLFRGHFGGPNGACGRATPDLHTGIDEMTPDYIPGYLESLTDAVLALSGGVGDYQRVNVQRNDLARWDAPGDPFSMESRGRYAAIGKDLFQRLSGQVSVDRVVQVDRMQWSGHVYNLTSDEGWFSANGLIVSNCDCIGIPSSESLAGDLTTDTGAAFRGMARPEQDQVFGKDGAQAIRDGADPARVVNARRGMVTADGRLYTTEAAGRRPRLMPEQIYREASGDRTEAVRLLKLHGYLI